MRDISAVEVIRPSHQWDEGFENILSDISDLSSLHGYKKQWWEKQWILVSWFCVCWQWGASSLSSRWGPRLEIYRFGKYKGMELMWSPEWEKRAGQYIRGRRASKYAVFVRISLSNNDPDKWGAYGIKGLFLTHTCALGANCGSAPSSLSRTHGWWDGRRKRAHGYSYTGS